MRPETSYIITDIEADGPDPGLHSMLSVASVACDGRGSVQSKFIINLTPLPDAVQNPDTMRWWQSHPQAWEDATRDPVEPGAAMQLWADWVKAQPGTPVFVAHPLTFDSSWIDWYTQKFLGQRLFYRPDDPGLTFAAGVDLPSLVMAQTGRDFQHCGRDHYPAEWLGGYEHNHNALADALGYAHLFKLAVNGELQKSSE